MFSGFVLIIFMATSSSSQSGAAAISQEFDTKERCEIAGKALADHAHSRGNNILTWGCFKK